MFDFLFFFLPLHQSLLSIPETLVACNAFVARYYAAIKQGKDIIVPPPVNWHQREKCGYNFITS